MENESIYMTKAREIAQLVNEKQKAYGDSFGQSHKIIEVLYPTGVTLDQMKDFLAIVRIIDKLFRIANKKTAFGEDPWMDVAGYSLLAASGPERDIAAELLKIDKDLTAIALVIKNKKPALPEK